MSLPNSDSPWAVIVAPVVKKRLSKIPNPDKQRLLDAIEALENGPCGDMKPLSGRSEWRLRVGNWRFLLDVDIEARMMLVLYVDSRGDIYKH